MCVIIDNRNGVKIHPDIIEGAVTINPDGFGYLNLETGQVTRTMDPNIATALFSQEVPAICHARYATVGGKEADNCHPFALPDDTGYLFQNGTVRDIIPDKGKTDCHALAQVLPYVNDAYQFLKRFDSRFLLWRDGQLVCTGEWFEHEGAWYSKDDVIDYANGTYYSGYYSSGKGYRTTGKTCSSDYGSSKRYWGPSRVTVESSYESNKWNSNSARGKDFYDDFDWDYDEAAGAYLPFRRYDDDDAGEFDTETRTNIIAVYGTLKWGEGNHRLLDGSLYLGDGMTVDKMRLVISGLPFLIENPHDDGHHVDVECYAVDDRTLRAIDGLEGHPHFYCREKIKIDLENEIVDAWVYMIPDDGRHDNGEYHEAYNRYAGDDDDFGFRESDK